MCPGSRKYIAGNIICQWIELLMNTVMIFIVSNIVGTVYAQGVTVHNLVVSLVVFAVTLAVRFFMTKMTTRMSYLASKTVKRVLREHIYEKLLKLGSSYRNTRRLLNSYRNQ
jgi:ATP-binding cassette subfamily C protein